METETTARTAGSGPRPWLLIALAAAVGLLLVVWMRSGKSAAPAAITSKPPAAAKTTAEAVNPEDLEVHLGALETPRPDGQSGARNPFRFYVPPPPPPPPPVAMPPRVGPPAQPVIPGGEQPQLPPIPLKFIGVMEVPGMGNVAAFSDCRTTFRGREGDILDGRYRVVRIGVESVVLEYADGRGRTTIRMSGQECVGKQGPV